MKNSIDELNLSCDRRYPKINPQFRVLVLHADELARTQATRLCENLIGSSAMGCHLESSCWDLHHPIDLEAVGEAVTRADLIFVAGCYNSELPFELQNALDLGLSDRRRDRGALVAMLGRADVKQGNPSALQISLQETARRNGLEFFIRMYQLPAKKHFYDSGRGGAGRLRLIYEAGFLQQITPDHCGIND